ncbi:MAG TPA: SCO family protein [Ktedonobacterales bacterium]|nr:SCO family protein [Ktedonobacterales bacterium]
MRQLDGTHKVALAICIATSALVVIAGVVWGVRLLKANNSQTAVQPPGLATAGFPLSGDPAPDFTLTDQFGKTQTLSSFRGQEVVLAFIDSRCKTLCPLTSTIMYNAKKQLGAGSKVALIAVNANPAATSVNEVESWSINHGMLHQWLFLTGSADQLQSIYRAYHVYDEVGSDGQLVHEPIIFVIDAQGRERLSYETLDSNAASDLRDQEAALEDGMRQWLPQS